MNGWIGVDLDGTLAMYEGWQGVNHIGDPIPLMVGRVKEWLSNGVEVRIVTARVADDPQRIPAIEESIKRWCRVHLGQEVPITNCKDFGMIELWDDRAVRVEKNTGIRIL